MKQLVLLFIVSVLGVLATCSCATAQTRHSITGKITDDAGTALPFVSVSLLQPADSIVLAYGLTDSEGVYTLHTAFSDHAILRVSLLGYAGYDTVVSTALANKLPDIKLSQAAYELEGVDVTAKKLPFEQTADRFIYNVSQNPLAKGIDAVTLFKHTPLLKVDNQDQISVWGKSDVQVLINGRRSHLTGETLSNYLRSLPAESIQSIEIITNPNSSFSAGGDMGVINIVLKKNESEGLSGSAQIRDYQNRFKNFPNANLNLNYRKGKIGISGNIWGGYNNFVSDSHSQTNIQNSNTRLSSTSKSEQGGALAGGRLAVDYNINNNHTLGASFDRSYYDSPKKLSDRSEYYNLSSFMLDSILNSRTNMTGSLNRTSAVLSYGYKDSTGRSVQADVSYSNSRNRTTAVTIGDRIAPDGSFIYEVDNFLEKIPALGDSWTAAVDYTEPLGKKSSLSTGLAYYDTKTDNDLFFGIPQGGEYVNDPKRSNHFIYKEKIGALYASFKHKWNQDWETTLGVRGEYTHSQGDQLASNEHFINNKFNVFPSLFIGYKNKLSYSITSRIQRPSFKDLNPFRVYFSVNSYVEGNPFLKSGQTLNQELSYTLHKRYVIKMNYNIVYDDWSQFMIAEDNNTLRYTNLNYGNKKKLGITLLQQENFFKGVWQMSNMLSYAYDQARGSIEDRPFNNHLSSVTFNTDNTFTLSKKSGWMLNISYFIMSSFIMGEIKFLPMSSLNAMIMKQFKSVSVSVYASDLFNTSVSRAIQETPTYDSYIFHNYGSRQFGFSVQYSFGNKKVKQSGNRRSSNAEVNKRL